jgi:hypothetical protein
MALDTPSGPAPANHAEQTPGGAIVVLTLP